MSKVGKGILKGLQEALQHERGQINTLRKSKRSRVEMSPDGKIERDYGKEDLNKDPSGLGTLIDREEPGHSAARADVARVSKEDSFQVDTDEMIDEHKKLINVLKSPSHKDDKKEAKKQSKELAEYKRKKKKKYTSSGIVNETPDSHDKFEPAQKVDRVDCDGAIDLDKSVVGRWDQIKKALDSSTAILDLEEAQKEDEQEEPEMPEGAAPEEGQPEEGSPQGDDQEMPPEDGMEQSVEEEGQGPSHEDEQELAQLLQAEGYSESEIAHIIHGHSPPQVDPVDQSKIEANQAKAKMDQDMAGHELENRKALSELDLNHKQRMNDLEFEGAKHKQSVPELEHEHRRRMLELEYESAKEDRSGSAIDREHKQRMLDLEYEAAKKEKELELEMKKKELEMKMHMKEQDAKKRQKERDMKKDADKTSRAERQGKDK